ncbi:hypothetical protein ET007_10130 [Lactococcus garvieae]|nr:hypothetical protein [Lactococcus garvieae]NHJ19253.1 hypothetical protein [Lactococcus garvieae]
MKIVIIGDSGAGKSTLAKEVSEILKIPILHLDKIWLDGFSNEDLVIGQEKFIEANVTDWIIEGNYKGTMNLRLPLADLIIWLEISPHKALQRVIQRSIRNRFLHDRSDVPSKFKEKFNKEWFEFLKYVWKNQEQNRVIFPEIIDKYHKSDKLMILKSKKDKEGFLEQCKYDFL